MHEFHLPAMTCGHCAATVNLALKLVDPTCEIAVDIPARKVQVFSTESREALTEALVESGYSPAA